MEQLETILAETTQTFRKGSQYTLEGAGDLLVAHEFNYPHVDDADEQKLTLIDTHFVIIGVDVNRAEARRADLLTWLRNYPEPERLAAGISYIEVGGVIGSQGMAFALFALGEALGLWRVVTPERLGITGPQADLLAGKGMVMMTGWSDK